MQTAPANAVPATDDANGTLSLSSGSKRHALESVPGTLVPGVSSGVAFIVIAHLAGNRALGLTSLAWVTASFGASVIALGPAHVALRAVAAGERNPLGEFRGVALARASVASPVVVVAGLLLAALGRSAGIPIALGGVWMVAQSFVLFESEVLRAEGQFLRSSMLLSIRSILGWTASVVGAALAGSLSAIVVPHLVVSAVIALGAGAMGVTRPGELTRAQARTLGRPIARLAVGSYALGYADRYVIAAVSGPSAVGIYTLGYTLGQGMLELVCTPITNALLPRIVAEWADHARGPRVAFATTRQASVVILVVSALTIPAVVVANQLGLLSLVSNNKDLAALTAIVGVATGIQMITRLAYALLLAQARTDQASRAFSLVVVLSAITVPALTVWYGIVGAAIATLIGYLVLAILMMRSAHQGSVGR
jgi:O-antigen/teichoic acid export membrane protein